MLFKCKYVNNVPTVVPLANMSDNITDNASQVTITDTHGISGSVGAVTDLQTLTNTGSQKAMNNLAELVNDATAPKNYAAGDHILRNGQYSKVKQAIQQGGSFTSSNLEAACIGDEISTLSSDLTVHTINQNSGYTGVNQTINAGSSYTAPADGLYSIELSGTDGSTGAIYLDSNRTKPLVLNKSSDLIGVLLPLKQGAIIYTRNTYGSYYVNGYVH